MIVWRNSKTSKDFNFTIAKDTGQADNMSLSIDDIKSNPSLNKNLNKSIKRLQLRNKDISWRYIPDMNAVENSKKKIHNNSISIDTSSRPRLESDSEHSNCTGYSTCREDESEPEIEPNTQPIKIEKVQFVTRRVFVPRVHEINDTKKLQFYGRISSRPKCIVMCCIRARYISDGTTRPRMVLDLKCLSPTCRFQGKVRVVKEKGPEIAGQVQTLKQYELVKDVDKTSTYESEVIVVTPHNCSYMYSGLSLFKGQKLDNVVPSSDQLANNQPSCSSIDPGRCSTPKEVSPEIEIPLVPENEEGFINFP